MGNCQIRDGISSDPSLPSLSPSTPSIEMNTAMKFSDVSTSQLKVSPFAPILPYTTHSNLAALYVRGSQLGHGQSGIICNCTSRSSGALYACKSISKIRIHTDVEDVIREVHIMKHLSHPIPSHASPISDIAPHDCFPGSIVRLYDVIEDRTYVHLIMELCHGGELFDRIVKKKCYPEAQAAYIVKSLLEAVQFCHSMGVIHRDIKPENILLVEDSDTSPIKLADFGLALEFSPGQKFCGMAGSTYYIAPEVLQGEYSEEVDMWSAGVIMYVLLSGVPPFWGATEQRIFKAIQKGDLSFHPNPWNKISSSAKDLIIQMLHPNPKLRLTPPQALKHPWILNHTKVSKHVHLNVTSRTSIAKKAGILGSHTSTFADTHNNQALRMSNVKPELSTILVDLIASMDRSTCSIVSGGLRKQRSRSGWTCTVLSMNGNEETIVVEMGQEKYLISHDRRNKIIGWKLLKSQNFPN